MAKRIDDLSNVKGSKLPEQSKRVSRTEASAREPNSSQSAKLIAGAVEHLFPNLSSNAKNKLTNRTLGIKEGPQNIGSG